MTKIVQNRKVIFGNGNVLIQSMTNLPVTDIDATCEQIQRLVASGCDIVRIAVPNKQAVDAFKVVRNNFSNVPLVADIHFDYRLAISAIEAGADKIRINPGNISEWQLDQVILAAKNNDVIVRIGVNSGSVNKQSLAEADGDKCLALYNSLAGYVHYFERKNFDKLVLSAKSSDVRETVKLNRMISKLGYPLHLGVTEAGLEEMGIVKNCIGIGSLLVDGIGDTIRVSLTADPEREVVTAMNILRALGIRKGVTFVSCPKCGRCTIDLENIAKEIYEYSKDFVAPIKIAIMGCEVNGPGECSDADIGIAGANGKFVFFRKGENFRTVSVEKGMKLFKQELTEIEDDYKRQQSRPLNDH